MPYPWQQEFWTASIIQRWAREREQIHKDNMIVAEMVLAGWRFVDCVGIWETYAPDGNYHGHNTTRADAAAYAQWVMHRGDPNEALTQSIIDNAETGHRVAGQQGWSVTGRRVAGQQPQ